MSGLIRQELAALEADIALCERCWGPERRTPVRFERPGERPGVLVLIERPPRGLLSRQDRLGISAEDAALRFLGEMLREAGIPPEDVQLGSSVSCRPHARRLEAAVPLGVCLRECSGHVRELIRLVGPRLVVPPGRVALRSLREAVREEPEVSALRFPESVGRAARAGCFTVVPLYHVTARARLSRPEPMQRRDWRALGDVWRGLVGAPA